MNITWSQKILQHLYSEGVREVISCAGARNSPIVTVLSMTQGLTLESFFEERSAAFFALGAARRSGRPVAVVTTSGTAAAELLPAVIEAFHTGVPLLVVTADRPRRLRGTGAPQSIDQTGLFAKFVDLEFDLENGEMFSLDSWNRRSPVHVNVCFDEPLLNETTSTLDLRLLVETEEHPSFAGSSVFQLSSGSEWAALRVTRFLKSDDFPIVVVGTLETDEERNAVAEFLTRLGAPVYLEGASGLREREELQGMALRSGERILSWALKQGLMSRVLRIGGVPTARIWRDLEDPACSVEVLSLSSLPFSGLSRGELICAEIAPALSGVTLQGLAEYRWVQILDFDRQMEEQLNALYAEEPDSEPSMIRALSKLVADDSMVYVGNSLPIREWDLAAERSRAFAIEANRGVNGIDGQISTFIGMTEEGRENWAILGDLTALYDLAAPWALSYRDGFKIRIVIVNNGGGKIFSRVFGNSMFENNHALGFEHWAKMWSLSYQKWTKVPERHEGATVEVIELVPDPHATTRFWDRYDQLWK